jgi:hypothetical protein
MTLVCRGLILDLDLPYRGFWVHFIVSEVARFMDHGWDRAPPRSGISSTFTEPLFRGVFSAFWASETDDVFTLNWTGPAGNEMGLVCGGLSLVF